MEGNDMFISRVEMPWNRTQNPYEYHRKLWSLFPNQPREVRGMHHEKRQGFLFRIEKRQVGSPVRFLLQSHRSPEAVPGLSLLGCREFYPKPQVGQRLAFVLNANATKKIRDQQMAAKPGKRTDKCRVPLIREEEQKSWLARKLDGAAVLESATVLPDPILYFRKGNRAGKLAALTFEGVLTVSAPDNLVYLLENGIGSAKAFGCGLMLVRRI
jgi:CRISPR system Cascade subunit CasE